MPFSDGLVTTWTIGLNFIFFCSLPTLVLRQIKSSFTILCFHLLDHHCDVQATALYPGLHSKRFRSTIPNLNVHVKVHTHSYVNIKLACCMVRVLTVVTPCRNSTCIIICVHSVTDYDMLIPTKFLWPLSGYSIPILIQNALTDVSACILYTKYI